MRRVLVVGQTPPPTHGQALAIQRLVDGRFRGIEIHHVPMRLSREMSEVGRFGARKLVEVLRLGVRVRTAQQRLACEILLYPPAGPDRLPFLRDALLLHLIRSRFEKVVFHFHAAGLSELYPQLSGAGRRLFRRTYRGARGAIELAPGLPDDGRFVGAEIVGIVPYGIEDVAGRRPERALSTPPALLFVGALHPEKGTIILVEACGILRDRGVEFVADLVGAAPGAAQATALAERVRALQLVERVRVVGELQGDAKWQRFGAADLFCFPSFYPREATPLVIYEAMQFALPTVATRWRGIPAQVQDGVTGALVEPRDPRMLADRLEALIADPDRRRELGRAARRRFEAEYTLERHLTAIEQFLLGL